MTLFLRLRFQHGPLCLCSIPTIGHEKTDIAVNCLIITIMIIIIAQSSQYKCRYPGKCEICGIHVFHFLLQTCHWLVITWYIGKPIWLYLNFILFAHLSKTVITFFAGRFNQSNRSQYIETGPNSAKSISFQLSKLFFSKPKDPFCDKIWR